MHKYFGDKTFYAMVLGVVVPIMVQNGITNFVSLLDNIMVGRVGTEPMSGVAIVNQLMFVFNLAVFGAISGAGIFGAQFYGCGRQEGVRHTFRFKLIIVTVLTVGACLLFFFGGDMLIKLYLHGEENKEALEAALHYGKQYLLIMLLSMPPFALEQSYTSTLRECGETVLPMKAGIIAVIINLCLNGVLIFGMFGFPAMGVAGAAIATVIARYVEMTIVVVWTHKHADRYPFITGAYKSLYIPGNLVSKILVKGMPLMVNEVMWAAGMATLMQCYSVRGLDAVAGLNISSTISNLFGVVYISMGNAVAIIIGQLLGAGKMKEARDTDTKLIAFSVVSCAAVGGVLAVLAPLFPEMYKTTEAVKKLATQFILIVALYIPMCAFLNACYFTLRAGGKTIVTFVFDSLFMWCVSIPFAFILSRYTAIPIVPLYLYCQMIELIKCVIGFVLVKKGVWITNIVAD
ncbi:MAG: MATE family efflux transporter [Lachnospiraceae bacterium]|nr:MATE family efflux transporter [Lachnospiraceae bacterium]